MKRAAACVLAGIVSCSSPSDRQPDIAALYEDAALVETRNPVIVIHGILGARLEQRSTGKTVWGAFTSDGVDPETEAGARAVALPLEPRESAADYDPESGDVVATGPLEAIKVGLLFQVFSVEIYAKIIMTLGAGGFTDRVVVDRSSPRYAEDHYTCFTYFYDWRQDNVANAIAFGRYLQATRRSVVFNAKKHAERLRSENKEAEAQVVDDWLRRGFKFDVVAHSMGGLIARYFLRFGMNDLPKDGSVPPVTWKGAEEIDRLVLVGTPSFGAVDALRNLTKGYDVGLFFPEYTQEILGSMPSIYQLLPRSRHGVLLDPKGETVDVDLFDPAVWERNRWGLARDGSDTYLRWLLPDVASADERRQRAVRYQAWCLGRARQLHEALDQPVERRCPAEIHLFAADTQPTLTRAVLKPSGSRLEVSFSGGKRLIEAGDGTVPRYSAIADERQGRPYHPGLESPVPWRNVTFISDDHVGLTKNPHFSNNLLFLLLERGLR